MNTLSSFILSDFLGGLPIRVRTLEKEIAIQPKVLEEDGKIVFNYSSGGVDAVITAEEDGENVIVSISLKSEKPLAADAVCFQSDTGVADEVLLNYHDKLWWMIGGFPKKGENLPDGIQGYLLRRGESHYAVVTLCGEEFRAEGDNTGLHLRTGIDGLTSLSGAVFSASVSADPIRAVEASFAAARNAKAIKAPLRVEREYPQMFEKFGWCSWNAFYQNITSEKLFRKLDEFKAKKIPVSWIIFDDGWYCVKDGKMTGFGADPVKFPEGLAACVKRIREEYGIAHVGIWHAFNGYWGGIHPESSLARDYADALMPAKDGMLVPSDDPDKAFRFWDAWHSYLADCGIDFLKVDNQSSTQTYLAGTVSTTSGARHAHEAIERSFVKNFNGRIINCMGMDMENALQRPFTAVSRNSDDFYPDLENGFAKHIMQNVYNAIWHSQMHHCDFDMWWSGKSAPVQSGVLRAISGGPVYVSDATGDSDLSTLLPVCGEDGDICRQDLVAMPTYDCIYVKCDTEKKPLKIFNRSGDAFALAIFNISREKITDKFRLDVIPGLEKNAEYLVYEYFSKTYRLVTSATEFDIAMDSDEVLAYSLYPVKGGVENRYVELGDATRYFGNSSRTKKRVAVSDICVI